jgi:glutathione synthase/RimK-type ligase-like ATP-grasp enzyme
MKTLVISVEDDPHIEAVRKHGIEFEVFDPSKFPFDTDVTYKLGHDGKFRVVSKGILLNNVTSVWYRKPRLLEENELPVPKEYQNFAYRAYRDGVKSIYDLLREKFWVSDYRSIMKAENKLFQLEVAHTLGFSVLPTMATSSKVEASGFHETHGDIVVKSFDFSIVEVEGDLKGFFTTLVRKDDNPDFSGLCVAPALLQKAVIEKTDIRVAVVGEEVLGCSITDFPTSEVDWRTGILTKGIRYNTYTLPPSVENKCRELVKTLGLKFGIIEFALDTNGIYWFLEINPNGQWLFMEEEAGLQISKAMANLLISHL